MSSEKKIALQVTDHDPTSPLISSATIVGELGLVQLRGRGHLDIADQKLTISLQQLLDIAGRVMTLLGSSEHHGTIFRRVLYDHGEQFVVFPEGGTPHAPDTKPEVKRRPF